MFHDDRIWFPASQQLRVAMVMMLLSSCCYANDPPTKKVRSPNDPDIDDKVAYLEEGENFERECTIRGGKEGGAPKLEFKDDEGLVLKNIPPRITITINRDEANNITRGVFSLQPATIEDNVYKEIFCRNADVGRSTSFKLKIIPKASIPSVRITENGKVVANQGSSKTITCSLKVQKGNVVKAFNITWATGDLKSASCEKGSSLPPDVSLEKYEMNSTAVVSNITILRMNHRHGTKFYCVACLNFEGSTSFDTVRKYSDYVDFKVTGPFKSVEEVRYSVKEDVALDCKAVVGTSGVLPNVTWYRKDWVVAGGPEDGEEVSLPKDSRYSFGESETTGTDVSSPQSVLKIAGVTLSDRAQYVCRQHLSKGNSTTVFYLRISDPKSGWYAVIGMVVEAILIIIIILATDYYKRWKDRRDETKKPTDAVWSAKDGSPAEEDPLMNSDADTSTVRVST